MIDSLLLLPLFAPFVTESRLVFFITTIIAVFLSESFSTLPPGSMALLYTVSLWTLFVCMDMFDTTSLGTLVVAFFISLGVYVCLYMLTFGMYYHMTIVGALTRGGVFMLRQIITGLFLTGIVFGIRYSISWIDYAFVEKKIT